MKERAGITNCLRDVELVLGSDRYQARTPMAEQGRASIAGHFFHRWMPVQHKLQSGFRHSIYLRCQSIDVVTACGTVTTTPALYNPGEFGSLLNAAGLTARINAQGVMTVQVGSLIYVARPDYLVTQGTPGAPALTMGPDGLLRFTDSTGHVQTLQPAFLEPEILGNQIAQAVGGYLVIQTDGTALVTLIGGQKYVLTPDLTLGTVPPEFFTVGWWQDGPNHYRYRSYNYANTSQGFTVTPR
jgi:hypothetical protein